MRPPARFPDGILFHTFYHQPQADLALEAIARAYGEELRPNLAEAARRALAGRRALLVLDGAEAADDLEAVLAVAGSCGVLITTRRHADAPAGWLDIGPLPPAEAVRLLQAWGGDCAADAGRGPAHRRPAGRAAAGALPGRPLPGPAPPARRRLPALAGEHAPGRPALRRAAAAAASRC